MDKLREKNLELLKKCSPKIFDKIKDFDTKDPVIEIFNNNLFCKRGGVLLHSKYNPVKESSNQVEAFLLKNNESKEIIVYGAALFYHIFQFIERDITTHIIISDLELFNESLSHIDLKTIVEKSKLYLHNEDFTELKGLPIFEHKVSIKVDNEKYEQFKLRLTLRKDSLKKYKILLVGPVYGGSLPIFYYCKSALEKLGHNLITLDNSIHKKSYDSISKTSENPYYQKKVMPEFVNILAEQVLITALEERVDIVLGIAQSPMTVNILERLKNSNIVTAFWFVEDFRTLEYWKGIAHKFDNFFTIQKEPFFSELKSLGAKNVHYLPMAADPEIHKTIEVDKEEIKRYGSTLSFIGAGYYNRRRFFTTLMDQDFKIWGDGWGNGSVLKPHFQENQRRVSSEECVKIFNSSKINLNLHSSSYTEGVNPTGDFVNPRTFEIAATGRVQFVDERSLLGELFDKDEIITFKDEESLKALIDQFKNNEEKFHLISKKSKKRVLKDHTYINRMREMISIIEATSETLQSKNSVVGNREALITGALEKGENELADFYRSVKGENVEVADIENYLSGKKVSDYSETDKILKIMTDFYQFAKRKNIV
ncbi:MAG: hypothetical protein CR982_08000 [Candidatus Cloacimonadota bacterium]|nr:MAG: hypothetical protein CR982_08000 [Candidatus Cloacimonadota bacterium]PIE77621.1 MAG: hypothetical protein CSA15_11900 [Candidatus Delongbacteria bacterium]